ncbi:hypothetical protein Javan290_0052 [Streptococcus phage Javan290]|uniref:hypothetical protein n=1 Tax=Streptococcus marmotae TaxID=1825069 RepID=UPI0008311912|nr:hypothetical protein [Streptococcus marmotae]QBX26106.1 hypothetical protein Javan290_0052 [Streptococcus phage Javan290]
MTFTEKLKNYFGLDAVEEEQPTIVSTDDKRWKQIAQEKHEEAILYQELYNEVMHENHRLRKTLQVFEEMRKADEYA